MRTDSIVYRKITARIAEMGWTRREIADQLGVSYGTLHNKLCAITQFTWDEVRTLKTILGWQGTLEDMLTRYDTMPAN